MTYETNSLIIFINGSLTFKYKEEFIMKEYLLKKYSILAKKQLNGIQVELWIPIKNYIEYEVSINGQVRNAKTHILLTPSKYTTQKGGNFVSLRKNCKTYKYSLPRIVLESFAKIPFCNGKIIHIDGNVLNNKLCNLEYADDKRTGNLLEFVPIPNHEEYLINKKGDIYSLKTKRVLRENFNNGYKIVALGKQTCYFVHRLVAITFIPNPNNFPVVNHKNAIKTDNRVENLEWCTQKFNAEHAMVNNLYECGSNRYNAKLKEKDIPVIKKLSSEGFSNSEIARRFDVDSSTIRHIIIGTRWKQC